MAQYTVQQIIDIAKVSGYLVANDTARGALFGQRLDPRWALRLYLERSAVEWMHAHDPAYPTLAATANYLFALCGGYGAQAAVVVASGGGGGILVPSQPASGTDTSLQGDFVYLVPIRGADFADATRYNDPRIAGEEVQVFWNEANRYLTASEFTHTPTGIQILDGPTGIEGFNAKTTHVDATFKIYIVHPDLPTGTTTVTTPGGGSSSGEALPFSGSGTYTLAAGSVLEYFIVLAGTAGTAFKVGTSADGADLVPESAVAPAGTLFTLHRYSYLGETLFLSGVPAGSIVVFFTKTVNLS
jgi:hypothetical protein